MRECAAGGIDWKDVSDPLMSAFPILGITFCVYMAFAVFCVLNIVTGVFVENAVAMTEMDEQQMLLQEMTERKKWIDEVKTLFDQASEQKQMEDGDVLSLIPWPTFHELCKDIQMQHLLKKLGIDVLAIDARSLFQLFDADGSGSIELDEFADGLKRFHGSATGVDLAQLRNGQRKIQADIKRLNAQVRRSEKRTLLRQTSPAQIAAATVQVVSSMKTNFAGNDCGNGFSSQISDSAAPAVIGHQLTTMRAQLERGKNSL